MTDTPRFVRHAEVCGTEIDAETFLTDPTDNEVFHLDQTGTALWHLLAEPHSLGEIQVVFRDAFPEVDPNQLHADLDGALAGLRERNLVVEA
jgi:hypothetical protein